VVIAERYIGQKFINMNNLICLIKYVVNRPVLRKDYCRVCTLPVSGYHPDKGKKNPNDKSDGRVEFWVHGEYIYSDSLPDDADNMCCIYKVEDGLIIKWYIGDNNKPYERKLKSYE